MRRTTELHLAGVEVARGVAACLVVFYHAARHVAQDIGVLPFGRLSQFGHAGVDFFFVLSGFIICFVHAGDIGRPDRTGHYLTRRTTRIYPIYWVVLGVTLALLALGSRAVVPSPGKILADFLLLPIGTPTLGIAWTLQYEMAFYAIFLVLILHRLAGLLLLAAWATFVLAKLAGLGPTCAGRSFRHRRPIVIAT